MEDIEAIKDYMISDEILRIKSLSREKLEEELIEINSGKIESLNNLASIKEYGKQK